MEENIKINKIKPFWNNQCLDISKQLWLPTEIDSDVNFWNGYSEQIISNSCFSMKTKKNNLQTTYSPSYAFLPLILPEKEDDIRARKIRIYPTQQQQRIIKGWMGTRRYVYNKTLDKINKKEIELNFYKLRDKLVTAKNNDNIKDWELKTPKDIRAGAINDLIKNHKTAFANMKNDNIKKFKMQFCKKRDSPSIEIPKTAIQIKEHKLSIFGTYFIQNKKDTKEKKEDDKTIKIAKKENLNFAVDHDCRLQFKNNKWYLVVPIKVNVKTKENKKAFCSLDPGIRSFQTIYSEDSVSQIKINQKLITKLQKKIDNFRSLRDRKIIKSKRLRRKERKIYFRINNLIDDLHYKTITYLTDTYDHIILPSFESQEMARRNNIRGINRNLLQLKHFLFKERLKAKCFLKKCTIDICTEEYTSKTCGVCGTLNKVNGTDVFSCKDCGLVIDRDVNGARNIAIKYIKEEM